MKATVVMCCGFGQRHQFIGIRFIAFASLVIMCADVLGQINVIDPGTKSHDATTSVTLIDFDPDPMSPDIAMVGNNYTADGLMTSPLLFNHFDKIDPSENNGIEGGGKSEVENSFSYGVAPGGIRIYAQARSDSSLINVGSNDLSMGSRTLSRAFTFSPVVIQEDDWYLSGSAYTTFARVNLQQAWGYSLFWDTGGSIEAVVNSVPGYQVNFLDPVSTPTLPTQHTSNLTPFYTQFHAFGSADTVEVSLEVNTEVRIIDGFMTPQGNLPEMEWPLTFALTHTVANLIPYFIGTDPATPVEPETSDTWDLPMIEYLDHVKDAFGMGLSKLLNNALLSTGLVGSNSLGSNSVPTAVTGGVSTVASNAVSPLVAVYLHMPNDLYYEVPFPDSDTQTFMTPSDELILSIDDFQSLGAPVHIIAEGMDLGLFDNGDSVDFESVFGHGVNEFEVVTTSSLVDPWVMKLHFDTQSPFLLVAVPEPASAVLFVPVVYFFMRRRWAA